MEVSSHRYSAKSGWDNAFDPAMDSANTLLIAFASARPDTPLKVELENLHKTFPQSIILGCSSSGEIYQEELLDDSIVVTVMQFNKTRLKLVHTDISAAEQSTATGNRLAEELIDDELAAVFTLTDGLLVNGSAYIAALSSSLPDHVTITGGMAGDGDRFEKTWILFDGTLQSGRVAAVGFYGNHVKVAHGSRGGWDLLGPDREVTDSENNVLYTLDSQPALEVYKKYLGDRADGLPATGLLFPIAIRNEEETDNMTVRTILAVDEQKQSITFAGDVPEGKFIKLMRANFDRLINGAADAAESLEMSDYDGSPTACIAISCVGRRLVLGARVEEELEAVKEVIPQGTPLIGYYSYGEISPLASGRCDLHNQTMTLTVFWENS